MLVRNTYKRRLFWYFFPVFVFFAFIVTIFQFKREKEYKVGQLESTLNQITVLVNNYINQQSITANSSYYLIDSLKSIIDRPEIRISIIDKNGLVQYDSFVEDVSELDNHLERQEIQEALYSEYGASIRKSASTGLDYYYYSKYFKAYFVRTAILYDISVKNFLKAEKLFLFFLVLSFFIMWGILSFVTDKLGKSVTKLKDISVKAGRNETLDENIKFPKSELGVISSQIIKIYNNLKLTRDELLMERDKLFNHLYVLNEGIAFFSNKKKKILTNNLFIHYLGLISDKPTLTTEHIFNIQDFEVINKFIDDNINKTITTGQKDLPKTEITIQKDKLFFKIQCIIFHDKNFEIIINDITDLEKRRIIKQQMTSNISHELKTPVSSIIGYLETLLHNDLDKKKRLYFTDKAFHQAERLSGLLNDISVLNKIEESGDLYEIEELDVNLMVKDVVENLENRIQKSNVKIDIHVGETILKGNKHLLFSIFQNLMENSINYAGENIMITITRYLEDKDNYYFSYSDNGPGIPEEHLNRIFERFYRIDSGRSRKLGGTGLGLSIVKNAVIRHDGNISVKNKKEGGLEFMFSLSKNLKS